MGWLYKHPVLLLVSCLVMSRVVPRNVLMGQIDILSTVDDA